MNNTTNNRVLLETENVTNALSLNDQNSLLFGFPLYYIFIATVLLSLAVYVKIAKKNRKPRNLIAIIGERYSGKTQLFMNLANGKKYSSVPSIHQSSTNMQINNRTFTLTDFYGDNICKEQVLSRLDEVQCIIHVIDGTDLTNFSDAAMFIYKTLINKKYQKRQCSYLILLNKKDEQGFIGVARAQQKLQDQIQHIKNSKINAGEEDQQGDEDYIKLSKGRFSIPFKIVEGSAQKNIQDLKMTIQSVL